MNTKQEKPEQQFGRSRKARNRAPHPAHEPGDDRQGDNEGDSEADRENHPECGVIATAAMAVGCVVMCGLIVFSKS